MNVSIIGTGAYGLALCSVLSKNKDNKITMWSENKETVKELTTTSTLKSLPELLLPKDITYTTSIENVCKNADIMFIVVAAKYVDDIVNYITPYYDKKTHICIASKGIEQDTCKFLHDIVLDSIKTKRLAVISGPSFAIDIINNEPIGLSIASDNKTTINVIKKAICNDTFKLRETDDIIGIELCGSIKNIIAIAAGIIHGLGYSESTQAFLINESMHDIKELIHRLGGKKQTILSFAGVGDLILTCSSTKSRNYSFGIVVAQAKGKEEIDNYLKNNTVEGYYTLKSIYKLIKTKKVKMPIIDLIYKIIINNEDPNKLIKFLVNKK